jgi:ankyrin repeat protein
MQPDARLETFKSTVLKENSVGASLTSDPAVVDGDITLEGDQTSSSPVIDPVVAETLREQPAIHSVASSVDRASLRDSSQDHETSTASPSVELGSDTVPALSSSESSSKTPSKTLTWAFEVHDGALVPSVFSLDQLQPMIKVAPLHHAALSGDTLRLQEILKVDKRAVYIKYAEVLPVEFAAMNGDIGSLKSLLDAGGPAGKSKTSVQLDALQWATVYGHQDAVKLLKHKYLLEHPCDLGFCIGSERYVLAGWTELSLSLYFCPPLAADLLKIPAVRAQDYTPRHAGAFSFSANFALVPPLHAALGSVQFFILSASFSRSSQPNLLNHTDLKQLKIQRPDLWSEIPLKATSTPERQIATIELLCNSGLHYNFSISQEDYYGFTPIHAAACGTSALVMKELLRRGAKVSSAPNPVSLSKVLNGRESLVKSKPDSPLHLAAFWNRTAIVELLLQEGADPNSSMRSRSTNRLLKVVSEDLTGFDISKMTALHYAAAMGNLQTISLLSAGGKVDACSDQGFVEESPLSLALKWEQWEAAVILIKAGADLRR